MDSLQHCILLVGSVPRYGSGAGCQLINAKIHLDLCVKGVVAEYAEYIRKSDSAQQGPNHSECRPSPQAMYTPARPDPRKHKIYHSFVAKIQPEFAATWVRFFGIRGIPGLFWTRLRSEDAFLGV